MPNQISSAKYIMATHQEDDKDKVRDVQHQEVVLNNEAPLDAPTHYPAVEFTIEESRKVLRKLDLHVCSEYTSYTRRTTPSRR